MTMSSRTPSQSKARPWRWCLAHPQPPPKCCSSHLPTPPSASRHRWPWHSSRPLCRTCVWPIGTRYRSTIQGPCSQEALAHPSMPRTPPSSPWTCVPCRSPHPSACRWPSELSPGTASPPPTEAATSARATRSPQVVSTDRAPLGHTEALETQAEEEDTDKGNSSEWGDREAVPTEPHCPWTERVRAFS